MEEMNGIWAIVNNDMICLEIYEGDINKFDFYKYSNYGGEVGIGGKWTYREGAVGKKFNHELDKFE
jgi:hypothetical protein